MAIAEISVVPSGVGPSVSAYVARAQEVIERHPNIKFQLTPMSTIIEGDLEAILAVVKDVHNSTFDEMVQRVLTSVKIDDRRDKEMTMEGKISSVKSRLAE